MSYSLSYSSALLLLTFVADKIALGRFEFVPLRVISEQISIPRPTLSKIVGALISSGILESKEGKHGGIRLKKRAQDFTLYDIFVAVEGEKPLFPDLPQFQATGARPERVREALQGVLDESYESFKKTLSKKKFAAFLRSIDKE